MVPRKTVSRSVRHRLGPVTSLVFVVAVAGACSAGTSPSGPRSGTPIANGSPWFGALTPVALPEPVNSLSALDCPTAGSCWAVGSTVGGAGASNGAAVITTTATVTPNVGDVSVPAADTWGLRSYKSPPSDPQAGDDVFDVYTLAQGKGLNGIAYREW